MKLELLQKEHKRIRV
ncbi:hypothetical protein HaLaN_13608 [Haematococcus lacustris]|uniref:Uncharacterized protein n=1 Tax=Haematococcus lacustris TaxID=44745 RepID=A0A699ZDU6_HAELA|nr:hypothetical protein HaLaN_13608 [Haematococcus lacustris]